MTPKIDPNTLNISRFLNKIITNTSENISNNKIAVNRAFDILAENVITGNKRLFDCTFKYRGLLGSIKKLIKRSV